MPRQLTWNRTVTESVLRPTTAGLIDCRSTVSRSGGDTDAIWIGALPAHPCGAGAAGSRTTAVGTDVADGIFASAVCLPSSSSLTRDDQDRVIDRLAAALAEVPV